MYVYMHVYTCICMYIYICMDIYMYIRYMYVYIYMHVYACMYIYIYTYICIHIYVYIYMYTYMHTHVYKYVNTYTYRITIIDVWPWGPFTRLVVLSICVCTNGTYICYIYIYISIHTQIHVCTNWRNVRPLFLYQTCRGAVAQMARANEDSPTQSWKRTCFSTVGPGQPETLPILFTWIFRSYCPLMSYGIFHDCRILNMLMQHKGCGFGYSPYLWTTSVDDVSITEESFIPSVVALSLGMPSLHQDCRFIWSSRHGRMILSILLKSDQVIPYHDHHIPQTSRCYSMKLQAIYRTRTSFLFKWVCGRAFPSQQIGRW